MQFRLQMASRQAPPRANGQRAALRVALRPSGSCWRVGRWLIVALGAIAIGRAAHAQVLRGAVRDSVTQTPLPGVVLQLLDDQGRALTRTISNERGLYALTASPAARSLVALRIGFRPRTVAYAAGATAMDLVMAPIPPLLEEVTVRASADCPARSDRLQALSLLQQARAGLLAAVTARETNRATAVRLNFEREMDGNSDRVERQTVTIDSSSGLTRTFGAARSGADFVRLGFVDVDRATNEQTYYGPDAETLIDDDFAAGYCFHVAGAQRSRPHEVGLGFRPASRRNRRVDIEGTLWIDTVARALDDVEFDYVGTVRPLGAAQPGGRVEFRQMSNGVVFIDRWLLSMIATRVDATAHDDVPTRVSYYTKQTGGEVAAAAWNDGLTYDAALGSARIQVVDRQNALASGFALRLAGTDYIGSPTARGVVEIPHLLPGPYNAVVIDSSFAELGITVPTSLRFEAERDSLAQHSVALPDYSRFVRHGCLDRAVQEPAQVTIRVTDRGDLAVGNVLVEISRDDGDPTRPVTERRFTDARGQIRSCLIYHLGDSFRIRVFGGPGRVVRGENRSYGNRPMVVRIVLDN